MTEKTTVIYNGACPICSREIDAYRAYAEPRALPIDFRDLHSADLERYGLTADAAAKRLHVVRDGELLVGVDAFLALWSDMPRFRWLARLLDRWPLRQIAGAVYDVVLAPALYGLHRRRMARRAH